MSVCVGQGRTPQVNVDDLWALRWHWLRNCHAVKYSHMGSEGLQKKHCQLTHSTAASINANWICYSSRKLYINWMQWWHGVLWARDHLRYSKRWCKCVRYSDESTFKLVSWKMDFEFSVPKTKGTIQTFITNRSKCKQLSWYGGAAEQTHWWLEYVRRYHWNGGMYWDCTDTILPSRWCLSWEVHHDNASSHSAFATTAWFCRHTECARLACLQSRSVSNWKCMISH